MKEHFVSILRKNDTPSCEFRQAASSLAKLLLAEAANYLPLQSLQIHTPLGIAKGAHLTHRVVLIVILRAGLAMLPAAMDLFPQSPIGFLGIRRDEETSTPHLYYQNLPKISSKDWILVLDPMLATGGTASLALEKLQQTGASLPQTILISMIAAQEGVDTFKKFSPLTQLVLAAIDPELNKKKFIVPGLGDFGDRFFDTV